MVFFYLDSSALVKRYSAEIGTPWVRSICQMSSADSVCISDITRVEVGSALARKAREGILTTAERDQLVEKLLRDCRLRFRVTIIDDAVQNLAISLTQKHPLRAYDAIQLAAALTTNTTLVALGLPPLVFVSADDMLLASAQMEGLSIDNPNLHP